LTFLNCLEHSGNYSALEILDPGRRRQPTEPTDRPTQPKPKTKPKPSTETIQYFVYSSSVANILRYRTYLSDDWEEVLRDVLEINHGDWKEITGGYPYKKPLLHTFQSLVLHWSLSKGVMGATIGVLYDQLKEYGREAAGGKLKTLNNVRSIN
jgi:hypothetical protein